MGLSTFTWNARNQLAGMTGPGLSASFLYDPLGRRIHKTLNSVLTQYAHDGINVVEELSASGSVVATLLTGVGVDEIFRRTDASGTQHFLSDVLGSTLALLDSLGLIQTEYTSTPFGETTATGMPSANTFQFTGRENDGTGLQYNRARYYHPVLQRFISEDPLGFGGGDINLYGYVGNDPVNGVDRFGLFDLTERAGEPLHPQTAEALECCETYLGRDPAVNPLVVTGAREPSPPHRPGSAHLTGQAIDLGKNSNPGLTRSDVEGCFGACRDISVGPIDPPIFGGFVYGQEEARPPHFHLQTRPGRGGATGFGQGIR